MKDKVQKNVSGRQRYFQLFITLGLDKLSLEAPKDQRALIDLLKLTKFVSQANLEFILYQLRITDRGREIQLANFSGQLERPETTQFPYWNIVFETNALTTKRQLRQAISQQIVASTSRLPNLTLFATTQFVKLDPRQRYILPNCDWYPGFFSRSIMVVLDLLAMEEVQTSIQENPEKYSILIDNFKNKQNQRNVL